MSFIYPRLNYSMSLRKILIGVFYFFSKTFVPKKLIEIFKSNQIYFFDNARSGLQFILSDLPMGSKVGVQPLTCPTVLESIENAGCKVVFIDINNQFIIDEKSLKDKIDRIDALIVTHTFGVVSDIDRIKKITGDKLLIEDCAHAFLSKFSDGNIAGTKADFALFSVGFAKFPSLVRGGYVIANNSRYISDFEKRYLKLTDCSMKEKVANILKMIILPVLNFPIIYSFITLNIKERKRTSFNYTKPVDSIILNKGYGMNIHILEYELRDIWNKLLAQQSNAQKILNSLHSNKKFETCEFQNRWNYFLVPALTPDPENFIKYMSLFGIEIGRHFVQSKQIISSYEYVKGDCPNYECIVNELITIPSHYAYKKQRIELIVKLIENYN